MGFIQTHMNKQIMLLGFVVGLVFATPGFGSDPLLNRELDFVLKDSHKYLKKFISPKNGNVLTFVKDTNELGVFLIFFSANRKTSIAYIVDENEDSLEATNYVFGELRNGEWILSHADQKSGELFESNGGVATLSLIRKTLENARKNPSAIKLRWYSGSPSRFIIDRNGSRKRAN